MTVMRWLVGFAVSRLRRVCCCVSFFEFGKDFDRGGGGGDTMPACSLLELVEHVVRGR